MSRQSTHLLSLLTLLLLLLLVADCSGKQRNANKHHKGQGNGGGAVAIRGNTNIAHSNVNNNNNNNNHHSNNAAERNSEFVKGKSKYICIGTNGRLSVPSNKQHHYRNLRDRYTNCTYVDGNLEITWLQSPEYDLSFLQHIREVTGYVLISHVDVPRVVLPRLQIIRGRTLFRVEIQKQEFALIVMNSQMFNLEMPALRDILNGSVGVIQNYNLCHIKTINWDEIITGPGRKYNYKFNFTTPERSCSECDKSCEQGCWGDGPENCQRFSKTNCSPQCWQGRCFGPNPRECCHLFCAGGCVGPKQSDCLACKNFYDDGVCTQECPPMQKYNPTTYSWEVNPDGKYAYGATCVRKCPEHLLKDNGACVRSCPPKKKALNGECVPCEGSCPKTCQGDQTVHSGNIDSFKDCTIIEGSISIFDHTFKGYQQIFSNNGSFGSRFEPMHPDRLEVFSTLKEITGYLNIQGDDKNFKNLSYFRNLEVIGGRALTEYFSSLYIVKTSLVSLQLSSLRKINSGSVAILENKDLCYAGTINWDKIRKSPEHESLLANNKNQTECIKEGLVCDEQCSEEGCWGPGAHQCLSCKNFMLNNNCVKNCNSPGIYQADSKNCMPCHEECNGTCTGPSAEHCVSCKHVRDGPFCVKECPSSKYNEGGVCKPCHENCVGGCEGPENNIGPNGCHSCDKAIMSSNSEAQLPEGCLPKKEVCPDGYFREWVSSQEQGALKPLAGKEICRMCHQGCAKCTGYGTHETVCLECVKYKRGHHCELECPADYYVESGTQNCLACHAECLGCHGPDSTDCTKCRNFKVFLDSDSSSSNDLSQDNSTLFNCTKACPPEFPHKNFPVNEGEIYCSQERAFAFDTELQPAILGGVGIFVIIFLAFAGLMMYQWRLRAKAKENTVKMTMAMTGLDDNEPLRPTGVKPNLAKLRIIKEEEMRKGGKLGFGAFGNVYKGVWVPEGENVKIPVAIKVLHEDTSGANTSKEFLDEAYIMASVEHPNLLQLLAVCMTSQMMLVTQLMPLGNLLDFVRTNKDKIGSKPMLNWCTQIARGMAYLEERRLVHRDLAARNVLVQTGNCVKITDFGLAKLLDINEEQYKAAGGKMPIKWLALECIQHRIFTHKSDVWAFGVTIWEVLTYGGRPYESVSARNVPELLEKGERLPQPAICTIDVYMIMIKCWMLDAESRPSFRELAEEFAKMSRDPGRYLAIKGDKYMRLPAYTMQDEKEIIKNLASSMDGPEALVDADEYLQPKCRAPLPPNLLSNSTSAGSGSPPATPIKTCWPNGVSLTGGSTNTMMDSPTPMQNQQNWDRELLRYGTAVLMQQQAQAQAQQQQLAAAVAAGSTNGSIVAGVSSANPSVTNTLQRSHYGRPNGHCHQGSGVNGLSGAAAGQQVNGGGVGSSAISENGSTRYCSDPLKMVRDCDVTDDGFAAEAAVQQHHQQQASVGGVKLDLPIDEDDYLMPSPALPTTKTQYMDLISEVTSAESLAKRLNNGYRKYPDFLNLPGKTSLDNPEYIMSQDEPPLTPQPLGIPTSPKDLEKVLANGAFAGINGQQIKQRGANEEESDHEYYNDFDRFERELQPLKPLRKNETTV
ncbi:epidermal growth factor receptor isoform X3 [Trichogramma pretiosum]|uniref:epidermal growth factor receptor isoform X3 n=1 Tax=Trichogramma pretiosum TaxID=7493 RepID=UPI0006C9B9CB|nr:epidermal growth factor receptor isoform X3 [Trichogramma pretiosum]